MSLEINPGETAYMAYKRRYLKPIIQKEWDKLISNPENASKFLDGKKLTPLGHEKMTQLMKDAFKIHEAHYNEWRRAQGVYIREVDPELCKKIISETVLPDARKLVVYSRGSKTRASIVAPDGSERKYALVAVKERPPKNPTGEKAESKWVLFLKSDEAKTIRDTLRKEALEKYMKEHPEDKNPQVKLSPSVTQRALGAAYSKIKAAEKEAAAAAAK